MTLIPARIAVDGSGDADEVGILIDGEIKPGSGPEQKLSSRSDGRVLAVMRSAGPEDVRPPYRVAAGAARAWAASGPAARAEVLHRAAGLFLQRADELAPIISADMGKPASEAKVEVAKGAAVLDYYAELGYRRLGT
ncbi:MAG: aldehyde dehydrogenase family protein, partial [Acidimicrobiaceae bacterium]|nr:aldehyde dehydrogenase family protein [Acidimicrobiaceae bacterium]